MVIEPPIIAIDSDGCVSVFESVPDAESSLEAPDVEDEEYRIYDSAGRRVTAHVVDEPERPRGLKRLRYQPPVKLAATAAEPVPVELRDQLELALRRLKGEPAVPHLTLGELIDALRHARC